MIPTRRLLQWICFAVLFGVSFRTVSDEPLRAPEYKIKAAYLYNFAVLTEWPTNTFQSRGDSLKICILGKDPFGWALEETMRHKKIAGRKVEIERIDELGDMEGCHMLFISSSEEEKVEKIIAGLADRPILTVSEIDRFNARGGIIWLKKQEDQIRFRIRQAGAREAHLKLSSKLLALSINAVPKKTKEEK